MINVELHDESSPCLTEETKTLISYYDKQMKALLYRIMNTQLLDVEMRTSVVTTVLSSNLMILFHQIPELIEPFEEILERLKSGIKDRLNCN